LASPSSQYQNRFLTSKSSGRFLLLSNVCYFLCLENIFVHFLLAQKTNQKRAASDLFWDYHFLGCPRITTHLRSAQAQTVMLTFCPSLRSLKNANQFQKRSEGVDRLTAIWLKFQTYSKQSSYPKFLSYCGFAIPTYFSDRFRFALAP